jgi:multiple antibiotic resistance protein
MNAVAFGALCFSSIFTVIDPIAAAPVFVSITKDRSRAEIRRLALRATLVASGVLLVFAVSGAYLFRLFGITIDAFRIGGGLVFLMLGLPMLSGSSHEDASEARPGEDPSVVPLGVPLIGGPGAITTVMLLMGQASGALHVAALFTALGVALLLTFLILLVAPRLLSRLGRAGTQLLTKIMGLIVVVIGVQFIVDGVRPIAIRHPEERHVELSWGAITANRASSRPRQTARALVIARRCSLCPTSLRERPSVRSRRRCQSGDSRRA